MLKTTSITEVIKQRFSVRKYQTLPIAEEIQAELRSRLEAIQHGPLGTPLRFKLLASSVSNRQALNKLRTYGSIQNPAGFLVGAVQAKPFALEDFGYGMEQAILAATELGLGSCWVGGLFTKSEFARKLDKQKDEIIPAVVPVGYTEESSRAYDGSKASVRADSRLPWEKLFFENQFNRSLTRESADPLATALDMIRQAPSARNKQPWRIVKDGNRWHFYCQRTPASSQEMLLFKLLGVADLQRIDLGIAMCHFELTAHQLGFLGRWQVLNPNLPPIDQNTFYIASWWEEENQ